ncbi:CPBP family intramembrane glutamic endopeptidase [Streptococcus devriesei]|uniref:CPBP family intramembrane glutamic endopeptidase n=1 Tax=Streptococcus devriesei TaxID=231233 RepID=UPI00041F790D|nr:CPBP family intramembrane glutamic endopeptidase [Streptococcus devriesei]
MSYSASRCIKFLTIFILCFLLNPYRFLPVADDIRQFLRFSVYIAVAINGIWLFRDDFAHTYLTFKQHIWRSLGSLVFLAVLILLGEVLSSVLMGILCQLFNSTEETLANQVYLEKLLNHRFLFLPAVVSVSLTGPVVEELVFRKSMIDLGKKYLPLPLIVSLQAVLFAAIHIHLFQTSEFINATPYLIAAFIYGIAYIRTDQIFYPIAVHIFFNTVNILMLLVLKIAAACL